MEKNPDHPCKHFLGTTKLPQVAWFGLANPNSHERREIWQSPASVLGSVVNSGDLSIPCEHFWESGDLPIPVIIQKILFLCLYMKAGR